ncbi:MAG: signal peptidase I [Clostridia bacterium]|nr:signal peptidase I [Clostridia bacterium]
MTLIEAVLKKTGCTNLSELKTVPAEQQKQLALVLKKIEPDKVPLEHWNTLLVAFGSRPAQTRENARIRLIRHLAGLPPSQPTAKPAPKPAPVPKPTPKQKSAFMRVWNVFTTLLVAVAVVLAVTLAGVRLVGLQVFTVLSGSMEPVYHVGSLIYVKTVDPADLVVGDDISFMLDEDTVATHRIVGIVPDENDPSVLRFRTKGTANEQEDGSLVHYKNVIGKPVFTIPYLGYIANYIQNPPGTYIAVSIGAVVMFLVFLPDLFGGEDEPKKPKKKKG